MLDPLCDAGWLACGTAAMTFDPLCGDGTGNAVRESILAAAVIRAAAAGESSERLIAHYRCRLLTARHALATWNSAARSTNPPTVDLGGNRNSLPSIAESRGATVCYGPFHYRLNGFELEKLPAA